MSNVSEKVQELRVELENKISFLNEKKKELQELESIFAPNRERLQSLRDEYQLVRSEYSEKESILSNLKKEFESYSNANPPRT